MNHPGENHDFDWVTARHGCSVRAMFLRLYKGAEHDVDLRNKLREQNEPSKWVVERRNDTYFVVYRESAVLGFASVEFDVKGSEISVVSVSSQDNQWEIKATVTLNDFGDCMLLVDGKQLYEWQVRKRALEQLLFSNFRARSI
jgi:hypothetical protein